MLFIAKIYVIIICVKYFIFFFLIAMFVSLNIVLEIKSDNKFNSIAVLLLITEANIIIICV